MNEEECFVKPGPEWLPRLIVIDGCNIGRSSCSVAREAVNCAGLMAVIRWLLVRDFDVVAFLPVVYNNSHNFNAVHVHLLTKLEELGLVTFTPARTGHGDRKAFINYDDLYVTTLAARHGGCVLSGDKFKDILAQPAYSEFHPVILNRTLDVKFRFLPHEVVYHKVDVFYKALPELFIYEDITIRAKMIARKIFASPDDPEFSKVLMRRELWNEKRKEDRINAIDDLLAELCERNAIRPLALRHLPGYQMESYEDFYNEAGDVFMSHTGFKSNPRTNRAVVDELWSDITSSSTTTTNVSDDFALIDFSEDCNLPTAHFDEQEPFEHPMDPFDIVPTSTRQKSSDSACISNCEGGSTHGYSMDDLYRHPKNSANSQEDVFQEIAAHTDTLKNTSDGGTSKEAGLESVNKAELISFSESPSNEPGRLHGDSAERKTDNKSQRPSDKAGTADTGRWPGNAYLEEEISYIGNNHYENNNNAQEPEIEAMLVSIFPVNIVQHVLSVNASRNIDFLADQCAELCA